jgi:hypothetical protein
MGALKRNRLLAERPLPQDGRERGARSGKVAARSVTVNLAESPLGWLKARGMVTERQFEAGERLRMGLGARADGAECDDALGRAAHGKGGARRARHQRSDNGADFGKTAVRGGGGGSRARAERDHVAGHLRGEGMRDAERALGWPARAGRLVLGLALDRLADYYRLR